MTTREKAIISEIDALKLLPGATFSGGEPDRRWFRYDIDWNGLKIEVKMSTKFPKWRFGLNRNGEDIDYLLWMGYKDMKLLKAFLVPAWVVSRLVSHNVEINLTDRHGRGCRRSKYLKYEVDLNKTISYKNLRA